MTTAKLLLGLEDYISNVGKHYRVPYLDDYKQEVFLILLQKGDKFLFELEKSGKLQAYCYKICLLLLYSKEGAYYKKYIYPRNYSNELRGNEQYNKNKNFNEETLETLIDSLTGYDRILITQLIECRGNKRALSKKANISYSTINLMLKDLSKRLKKDWKLDDFFD